MIRIILGNSERTQLNAVAMSQINLTTLAQNLNIQSAEQLALYVGFLMHNLYPTKQAKETEQSTQLCCQFNLFQLADGSDRALIRMSLPIDPTFTSDRTKKLWMFASDMGDLVIPATFLTN